MREFDSNGLKLCEYQAELFELSYDLDCSSKIFLQRFINSNLVKTLDSNESAFISVPKEGLLSIKEQYGALSWGSFKYNKEILFWMGYMYRYISYTRQTNTKFIFNLFPNDMLSNLYYSYHSQDPEWCISSMLEMINKTEDIFDIDWRIKQAILKSDYYSKLKLQSNI